MTYKPVRAVACIILSLAMSLIAQEAAKPSLPEKPADLFQTTRVWNIHLTFTPEQWAALEPKQAERSPFGGRNERRGPMVFGPGMILAPAFLKAADANQDGKLSKDEFASLADKWFGEWDKSKAGQLNNDQLRAGLDAALALAGPPVPQPGRNNFLQGDEGKRNGLSSAQGIEFEYVHADLEFDGKVIKDVGVRYKGNGTYMQSRGTLKRSLKIDLNQYVKGQKLAEQTQLNLHTNVTDPSWMNEVLSHRLYRDAGIAAPRSAYARVYVSVPGKHDRQYLGLYSMIEDIGKSFVEERFDTKKGAILKPVTPAPFTDMGNEWAAYNQIYDPKLDLSKKETARIIAFCKLVSHATDAEFAERAPEYLDLDQFARYMAATVYLSTLDSILSIGQNYYVYLHPKTEKLQFISWDLDHSFGQFGMSGGQDEREQLSIHRPWRGDNRFLDRVYKLDAFKQLYLAHLKEFSQTIFKPERFHEQVNEVAAAIRPAIKEESEQQLARFDTVVSGKPAGPEGLMGWFRGPGQSPKPIKGFVSARTPSVVNQLAGKSQGIVLEGGGFGGRGGGRGMPGPGAFVAPMLMTTFDTDRNGQLVRDELSQGFARWFEAWDTDKTGLLTHEQLQAGLSRDLAPRDMRGGGQDFRDDRGGRDNRRGGGGPGGGFGPARAQ